MRDFQRQKVYDWENEHIRPKMSNAIKPIETLQLLADHMWSNLGLENPPKVNFYDRYKAKSTGGRYNIKLMRSMATEFVLAHELAHSLNQREDFDDRYDSHGPKYVADYITVLVKFYGFDPHSLLYTAKKEKVKVDTGLLFQSLTPGDF